MVSSPHKMFEQGLYYFKSTQSPGAVPIIPCYHTANLAWNHPTLLSETVEVFIFPSLSSSGGKLAGGGELLRHVKHVAVPHRGEGDDSDRAVPTASV